MNDRICPLSLIGGRGNPCNCHGKSCMFWVDFADDVSTCAIVTHLLSMWTAYTMDKNEEREIFKDKTLGNRDVV